MQSTYFDFDPTDILARRMVKTEKALDYFIGDDFPCLAQSRHTPSVLTREPGLSAGQLWVFRIHDPSTRTPFLVLL